MNIFCACSPVKMKLTALTKSFCTEPLTCPALRWSLRTWPFEKITAGVPVANICMIESILHEFVEAQDYTAINCRRNKQKSWNKIMGLFLIRCLAIHHSYFSLCKYPVGVGKPFHSLTFLSPPPTHTGLRKSLHVRGALTLLSKAPTSCHPVDKTYQALSQKHLGCLPCLCSLVSLPWCMKVF